MSELASGIASAANSAPAPEAPASTPSPTPAQPAAPSSFSSLGDAFQHFKVGDESAPAPNVTEGEAPATVAPPTEQVAESPESRLHWKDIEAHPAHKTAVENARAKEREAVMAELQQQIEPIRGMVPLAQAIQHDVATGTIQGLNQLLNEYAAHPVLGPQLRSEFGRALARMRGQTPAPQADVEPEPDLQLQDGTTVYSAAQLAKREQWFANRLKADIGKQYEPLQKLQERVVEAQKADGETRAYVQRVSPLAAELQQMPGFSDYRTEIGQKQAELFKQSPSADPMQLWFRAYREIVPAKLQAKQHEQLRESAVAASAGRSVNPAVVNPNPPGTPQSLREAFAQVGLR